MSIRTALERLVDLIEMADTDGGTLLQANDDDHGMPPMLGVLPEGPGRAFELSPGSAEDGGEGGCIPARVRLTVRLRVRYRMAGSRLDRLTRMDSDWQAIRDATMFAPGQWQTVTSTISYIGLGGYTVEAIISPGQTVPTHEVMAADFIVEVEP
jgi:hypothetical protein